MSECNRGVWQLGHANVLLMFSGGCGWERCSYAGVNLEALKHILHSPYSFFFVSCQINIAQGDFWFFSSFSGQTGGEAKLGFLCWGFGVRCKLPWQGPGPVCGNSASVQRVTHMLTALLFLEIQNRTAEHTLVTWNLRWRALIKLNHKQHPAQLISHSLCSLFNSPSLSPLLHRAICTTCHCLTVFLCFFSFLPSPISLPSWAAELTAHLALAHRAHSELGEINSDKHCT